MKTALAPSVNIVFVSRDSEVLHVCHSDGNFAGTLQSEPPFAVV
ncbi:hypothetical protein [Sinorhizobium fredii]|nr:hypothetical protein [Sinorhizobium fredii]AWM28954.1 hypothetical protein AOX55_00006179 [Sinorhizobium fredii CCBAU 25509]